MILAIKSASNLSESVFQFLKMSHIMKFLLPLVLLLFACKSSQNISKTDESAILKTLQTQEAAWNEGNLDAFMVGYWPSDSLLFIGKSGLTFGWQNTLANYRKGYPDRAAMGTLHFDILKLKKLGRQHCFVVGKWNLARPEKGDIGGHFSLLFEKIAGRWVIVADHSS